MTTPLRPTSPAFDRALALTLRFEGGYVDDPDDPGGATNRGITQRVYDRWRTLHGLPAQPVKLCSTYEVRAVYWDFYWHALGCDRLTPELGLCVFDTAVHSGAKRAQQFLDFTTRPALYLDQREAFLRELVRRRPRSRKYLAGWLRRLALLRGAVTALAA